MPGDTCFVPKADVVYAVGSVTKPGGFPIGENETLSALQVVSLAEGIVKTAAGDRAKILRLAPGGGPRSEIPINLKLLMAGKGGDCCCGPTTFCLCPTATPRAWLIAQSTPSSPRPPALRFTAATDRRGFRL